MSNVSKSRVWLVTGASGGLGTAFATAALEGGDRVLCAARKKDGVQALVDKYPDQAYALAWDVTNKADAQRAIEEGIAQFGRLDIVVNNAGTGTYGAVEELPTDQVEELFRINLLGPLFVLQATLPHLREQRSGRVINISSMSGFVGAAGTGAYNITKFALEGLSEALAEEVKPLGIHVTIVEPGPFRTAFGHGAPEPPPGLPDYAETSGRMVKMMTTIGQWAPGDPQKAAKAIFKITRSETPPLRLALGSISVDAIRKKLQQVEQDLGAWHDLAYSTDIPGAAAPAGAV